MSSDFTGSVALVTGSSRGIGLEIAHAFAAAGATVALNSRNPGQVRETRRLLEERLADTGSTGRVIEAAFDVTDEAAVDTAVAALQSAAGPIHMLVNNAGIQRRRPLIELSLAEWRQVLDTNLTGAFLVSRAAAPGMIAAGTGSIVNICSVQTSIVRPTTAAYAASKTGLAGLTRAMCAEWAVHGLRINGLAPGYIDTDLNAALVGDPTFSEWITARTPARRWGMPADITGPALWLCSEEARFINGQIIYADGGMTAVI